jgi:chemotaxis protein CheX
VTATPDSEIFMDPASLEEIVSEVLASLGVLSDPAWDPVEGEIDTVGTVSVSGAWNGTIQIELPTGVDRVMAAAMFQMEDDEVGDEEIVDSVGELANMIGGMVKSMMPEPSRLSLPQVINGHSLSLTVPGGNLLLDTTRTCPGGWIKTTIWSGPQA